MAPTSADSVDDRLKTVIQNLFEIQSNVHGYLGPETQQGLVRNIHQLTTSLSALSDSSSALSDSSSALPVHLPPEIIDYIDQGRNPDIYTRELVESVQRSNQFLKGKSEAFAGFRDCLADEIIKHLPEAEAKVKDILGGKGMGEETKVNGC
ncbi:hypothetical protein N7G274_004259 [Stereocaulon virgatum]|uniref:Mediator of RNA polymerase II transcription subunit 10 n=1 Tax=Stereocaulon virgatum TaxID=373712 RepID=A0ABR4ABF2_9LECA